MGDQPEAPILPCRWVTQKSQNSICMTTSWDWKSEFAIFCGVIYQWFFCDIAVLIEWFVSNLWLASVSFRAKRGLQGGSRDQAESAFVFRTEDGKPAVGKGCRGLFKGIRDTIRSFVHDEDEE